MEKLFETIFFGTITFGLAILAVIGLSYLVIEFIRYVKERKREGWY